jgi:hypothetical protein
MAHAKFRSRSNQFRYGVGGQSLAGDNVGSSQPSDNIGNQEFSEPINALADGNVVWAWLQLGSIQVAMAKKSITFSGSPRNVASLQQLLHRESLKTTKTAYRESVRLRNNIASGGCMAMPWAL